MTFQRPSSLLIRIPRTSQGFQGLIKKSKILPGIANPVAVFTVILEARHEKQRQITGHLRFLTFTDLYGLDTDILITFFYIKIKLALSLN